MRATPREVLLWHVPMLILAVVLLAASWDGEDWREWELILGLAALAVVGALRPVDFGRMMLNTFTLSVLVAAALAGPGPAAFVGVLATLFVWDPLRPWHYVFLNLATTALWATIAGIAIRASLTAGWASPGDASFGLAVLVIGVGASALNFALLVPSTWLEGVQPLEAVRTTFIPVIPFETLIALLSAVIVMSYETIGMYALLGLGLAVAVSIWVIGLLSRGERIGLDVERLTQELLSAGEAERRRLAAALHDDALQRLSVARQDLAEGLAGDEQTNLRAQEALAETIQSLRALMVELDTSAPPASSVDAIASRIAARSGLTILLDVDSECESDEDVVACVGELLRNVEKHARARHAWVTVADGVVEVADDGVGPGTGMDLHEAFTAGHLGLALVARRARARGGDFTLRPRQEGGSIARAVLHPARGAVR